MSDKRPIAKLAKDGYVQIQLAEPPGCVARAETGIKALLWLLAWFWLGFVVGALVMRVWG